MGLTFVRGNYMETLIQDVGYRKNNVSSSYCCPALGGFQHSLFKFLFINILII